MDLKTTLLKWAEVFYFWDGMSELTPRTQGLRVLFNESFYSRLRAMRYGLTDEWYVVYADIRLLVTVFEIIDLYNNVKATSYRTKLVRDWYIRQ